jgi:ubiquinone/menaquinone biosynthesis C-methylase UbiE
MNHITKERITDVIDEILFPFKQMIPQPIVEKIPFLASNREIRIKNVLRYVPRGSNCLDIGCGANDLIKKHREYKGRGIGVDVYDFGGADLIINDSSRLPFADRSFDCVTFVASLNHISNRDKALEESHRVLSDQGVLIVTFLAPAISYIWHKICFWDYDQRKRGMKEGETYGFDKNEIHSLLNNAGFDVIKHKKFSWKLNNICVCSKKRKSLS